jgi:hypothetical protein
MSIRLERAVVDPFGTGRCRSVWNGPFGRISAETDFGDVNPSLRRRSLAILRERTPRGDPLVPFDWALSAVSSFFRRIFAPIYGFSVGARLIEASATHFDLAKKEIVLNDGSRPSMPFDVGNLRPKLWKSGFLLFLLRRFSKEGDSPLAGCGVGSFEDPSSTL